VKAGAIGAVKLATQHGATYASFIFVLRTAAALRPPLKWRTRDAKVDAVIRDARRRQRKRRSLLVVLAFSAVVIGALSWHFGTGGGGGPRDSLSNAIGGGSRSITDGVLRVPVPQGGTGSVNPGFQGRSPIAWILVGNFHFPASWGPQHREGSPAVPRNGVLIVVGDFIPGAYSADWPRVRALQLPRRAAGSRVVSWNVQFAGRALRLSAQFGSVPDAQTLQLARNLLAGIRTA
jgi:hypothetical protein